MSYDANSILRAVQVCSGSNMCGEYPDAVVLSFSRSQAAFLVGDLWQGFQINTGGVSLRETVKPLDPLAVCPVDLAKTYNYIP